MRLEDGRCQECEENEQLEITDAGESCQCRAPFITNSDGRCSKDCPEHELREVGYRRVRKYSGYLNAYVCDVCNNYTRP